jgi:hypothetical protein
VALAGVDVTAQSKRWRRIQLVGIALMRLALGMFGLLGVSVSVDPIGATTHPSWRGPAGWLALAVSVLGAGLFCASLIARAVQRRSAATNRIQPSVGDGNG